MRRNNLLLFPPAYSSITVLDLAETFIGEKKSGSKTVRLIIQIYKDIREFAKLFQEDDGEGLLLASTCLFTPENGAECSGGLVDFLDDDGSRRLIEMRQEMQETFVTYDASGLPVSPAHRFLADCTASFVGPDCEGSCTGCGSKANTAKCKGRELACKAKNVQGLRLPFLEDPASCIGLLSGGDIEIIEFAPPPISFLFEYEFGTVIYSPPVVELKVLFSVSVTLEYALVLDSRGIREAVSENLPLKALNSFGIRDTFDGVDKPLVVFEASITAAVEVSAAIVKIGVSGGIIITVQIDLVDPYPDTSGGVVRPFELFAINPNPLSWFEVTLTITLVSP